MTRLSVSDTIALTGVGIVACALPVVAVAGPVAGLRTFLVGIAVCLVAFVAGLVREGWR